MIFLLSKEESQEYELKRPLKILIHSQATLYPISTINNKLNGGIQLQDKSFCNLSKITRVAPISSKLVFNDWYSDLDLSIADKTEKKHIDEDVIFIGPIPDHYGHFITEGLSRLWPLLSLENQDKKIVYISENKINFTDFFILFGIDQSRIKRITEPTTFKSITVSEPSIRLHDYYHQSYGETVKKILSNVPTDKENSIFLSKNENKRNGKSIGEKNIMNIFKKNGYEIVYPELLSVKDFLSKVYSAKRVVALSASSAHNAVFMKTGSELVCLNRSDHHHPLQIMINKMRNLKVTYCDVSLNFFKPNISNGPYNIIISKYLIIFLGMQKLKIPNKIIILLMNLSSSIYYILHYLFFGKVFRSISLLKARLKNF